jgi:hypothetical protein
MEAGHRGREGDDRTAGPEPAGGLGGDHEGAPDVGAVHPVERVEVQLGHGGQVHHTGHVGDHVDAAVPLLGQVKNGSDGRLVGHVRLDRDGGPAGGLDRRHGVLGLGLVARVDDDDVLAVGREPLGDRTADATGSAGDDRDAGVVAGHGDSFDSGAHADNVTTLTTLASSR